MEVSFQFTCRSGVGVQVIGQDDHVDLLVLLNSTTYQAPPLPPRQTDMWPKDRLNALDPAAAQLITFDQIASMLTLPIFRPPGFGLIDLANAEQALALGVETEHYDIPEVNALDRTHAVPFVPVTQSRQARASLSMTASPTQCSASSRSASIVSLSSATSKRPAQPQPSRKDEVMTITRPRPRPRFYIGTASGDIRPDHRSPAVAAGLDRGTHQGGPGPRIRLGRMDSCHNLGHSDTAPVEICAARIGPEPRPSNRQAGHRTHAIPRRLNRVLPTAPIWRGAACVLRARA